MSWTSAWTVYAKSVPSGDQEPAEGRVRRTFALSRCNVLHSARCGELRWVPECAPLDRNQNRSSLFTLTMRVRLTGSGKPAERVSRWSL